MNRPAIRGRAFVVELHAEAIRTIAEDGNVDASDADNIRERCKQIIKETNHIMAYLVTPPTPEQQAAINELVEAARHLPPKPQPRRRRRA